MTLSPFEHTTSHHAAGDTMNLAGLIREATDAIERYPTRAARHLRQALDLLHCQTPIVSFGHFPAATARGDHGSRDHPQNRSAALPRPDLKMARFNGATAAIRKWEGKTDPGPTLVSTSWRLLVILETVGGRFSLAEQGQRRQVPGSQPPGNQPHAMFLIPPGVVVETHLQAVRLVRFLDLQFEPDRFASLFQGGRLPKFPEAIRLGFFDARLLGLARLYESECGLEGRDFSSFGDSLNVSLLTALASLPDVTDGDPLTGGLTPRQLRRATDFLEQNLAEPVRPGDLAAKLGFSRSHFCRAFKASTGLPPHAWQLARRIERAREMIIDGKLPLVDIALATGFTDQPHFTRMFTRAVGVPPGQWRRKLATLAA